MFLKLLIGPEILWAFFYLITLAWSSPAIAASPARNDRALRFVWIVPLILLPLSWLPYWTPWALKSWFGARLWLSGLIGGHFVLERGLSVHSEQGPGVGSAYIVGILFLLLIISVLSILVLFV